MTFNDLKITAAEMRNGNEDVFNTKYLATLTSSSANVTVNNTANLSAGLTVTGVGIPTSTTISSITSSTVFVISHAATKSGNIEITIQTTSDTDLEELYKTIAKSKLKADLCKHYNLEENGTNDMQILDDIVNKFPNEIRRALMFKQIFHYYLQNDGGEGSVTRLRMKFYSDEYYMEANNFPRYNSDSFVPLTIVPVMRG